MLEFKMKDTQDIYYLYVERSCSMDPADISQNMGSAFGTVWEHIESQGIASADKALSVYYEYDENRMSFRAGFIVSADDARRVDGEVRGDRLPAGRVLNFVHHGPYAKLRESYAEMMRYLDANSLAVAAPTAEIYLNDPGSVDSENDLQTDIYVAVRPA